MSKNVIEKLVNTVSVFIIIILIIAVLSTIVSKEKIPSFLFYSLFLVETGSMEPKLSPGDVIFTRPNENPQVNDVITFKNSHNFYVTHRIIKIIEENNTKLYETKGDANNIPDQHLISAENIIGTHTFTIPKLGYALQFIKHPLGLFLVLVIGLTCLLIPKIRKNLSHT